MIWHQFVDLHIYIGFYFLYKQRNLRIHIFLVNDGISKPINIQLRSIIFIILNY